MFNRIVLTLALLLALAPVALSQSTAPERRDYKKMQERTQAQIPTPSALFVNLFYNSVAGKWQFKKSDGSFFDVGSAGSTSAAWDTITAPTTTPFALNHGNNLTTFTWGAATGAGADMFTFTDTASNTGTGDVVMIYTGAGSAAKPLTVTAQGALNGVQMSTTGALAAIGTGSITANALTSGATIAGLTQGSVPFAGASGAISQDNANLFWDATNARLGIGTLSPTHVLEVVRSQNATETIALSNLTSGTASTAGFSINSSSGIGSILATSELYTGTAPADALIVQSEVNLSGGLLLRSASTGPVAIAVNGTTSATFLDGGNVGIGVSPSSRLHVKGSSDVNSYIRVDDSAAAAQVILGAENATPSGFVGTLTSYDFAIRTNNTSRATFSSTGASFAVPVKYAGSTSGALTNTVPATVTSYTLTWPSAQGGAGTVPTNDGSGGLSWAAPSLTIGQALSGSTSGAVLFASSGTLGEDPGYLDYDTGNARLTTYELRSTIASLRGSTSGLLTHAVPATVTSYTLTWPSAQGAVGSVPTNDGSGGLSWTVPSSGGAPVGAQYVALATDGTLTNERVLTGTSNQIVITDSGAGAAVTLSLPQSIATSSAVRLGSLALGGALPTGANLAIPLAPGANANYGSVSIGAGAFDGSTTGFFTGSSNGTQIAINGATGSTADLLDAQVAGVVKGKLTSTGALSLAGAVLPTTAAAWDLGSATLPVKDLWVAGSSGTPASNNFRITGTATAARVITLPDSSITVARTDAGQTFTGNQGVGGAAVSQLTVPVAPTASANYATLSIGSGAFDGSTSGFFTGASAGTQIGINAASGSTADLTNYQIAGVMRHKQASTGVVSDTATDAGTNTITDLYIGGHNTSGTPAASFGTGILLNGQSTTTADRNMARISSIWTTATDASRASAITFQTVTAAGALAEMARFSGTGILTLGGTGTLTDNASNTITLARSSASLALNSSTSAVTLTANQTSLALGAANGGTHFNFTPGNASSSTVSDFVLTGSAPTAQATTVERVGVNFNLAQTKQWAQGNITTQREFLVQAPTYGFATSASTVTSAATFAVTGPPIAGTNATLTNAYALWVQTGNSFLAGGVATGVAAKTGNYTATTGDTTILVDATGGAVTITLPAATKSGSIIFVKKIDSSINAVTVSRAGSDTIEGATTVILATQYSSAMVQADGTSIWYKISSL